MTDGVRQPCKRTDGLTKLGYHTHAQAKKAARIASRNPNVGKGKGGLRLAPYKCVDCGLYHLGHSTPGRDRRTSTEP